MPSTNDHGAPKPRRANRKTLQRLRREAGWKSARDFAERIGVPLSTYSRYENTGDGPDCRIPLPQAWKIADELGTSIDLVVGREDIDAPRDELRERADHLTATSRLMLGEFLDFLEEHDKRELPQGRRPR